MGIFFSVISAAIFGVNNYIDKFLLEKNNITPVVITIYGGIFAFIVGLIALFITNFYPIDTKSIVIILSSGFLTTIYLLPYYKALSIDETSYVIPLFQFYPIFVLILGFILLHESLSTSQYLGSLIIILGGFLLSIEKLDRKIFKLRKSFWYMILSSILFAFAQILFKFGVEDLPFWSLLPYEGFGIAIGALSVAVYKNNFSRFKKETRSFKKRVFVYMGINEAIYILSRYTGYFAISLISVGLVSVLASLQPLFVLIYGIILSVWFPYLIKEVINKKVIFRKVASIALMSLGMLLIVS